MGPFGGQGPPKWVLVLFFSILCGCSPTFTQEELQDGMCRYGESYVPETIFHHLTGWSCFEDIDYNDDIYHIYVCVTEDGYKVPCLKDWQIYNDFASVESRKRILSKMVALENQKKLEWCFKENTNCISKSNSNIANRNLGSNSVSRVWIPASACDTESRNKFHIAMLAISFIMGVPATITLIYFSWTGKSAFLSLYRNLTAAVTFRTLITLLIQTEVILPMAEGSANIDSSGIPALGSFETFFLDLVLGFWLVIAIQVWQFQKNQYKVTPSINSYTYIVTGISCIFTVIWIIVMACTQDKWQWVGVRYWSQWINDPIRIIFLLAQIILTGAFIHHLFKHPIKKDVDSGGKLGLKVRGAGWLQCILTPIFILQYSLNAGTPASDACQEAFFYTLYFVDGIQGALVCIFFFYLDSEVRVILKEKFGLLEEPQVQHTPIKTLDSIREQRYGDASKDVVYSSVVNPDRYEKTLQVYQKANLVAKPSSTVVDGDVFLTCDPDLNRKFSTVSEYYDAHSYTGSMVAIDIEENSPQEDEKVEETSDTQNYTPISESKYSTIKHKNYKSESWQSSYLEQSDNAKKKEIVITLSEFDGSETKDDEVQVARSSSRASRSSSTSAESIKNYPMTKKINDKPENYRSSTMAVKGTSSEESLDMKNHDIKDTPYFGKAEITENKPKKLHKREANNFLSPLPRLSNDSSSDSSEEEMMPGKNRRNSNLSHWKTRDDLSSDVENDQLYNELPKSQNGKEPYRIGNTTEQRRSSSSSKSSSNSSSSSSIPPENNTLTKGPSIQKSFESNEGDLQNNDGEPAQHPLPPSNVEKKKISMSISSESEGDTGILEEKAIEPFLKTKEREIPVEIQKVNIETSSILDDVVEDQNSVPKLQEDESYQNDSSSNSSDSEDDETTPKLNTEPIIIPFWIKRKIAAENGVANDDGSELEIENQNEIQKPDRENISTGKNSAATKEIIEEHPTSQKNLLSRKDSNEDGDKTPKIQLQDPLIPFWIKRKMAADNEEKLKPNFQQEKPKKIKHSSESSSSSDSENEKAQNSENNPEITHGKEIQQKYIRNPPLKIIHNNEKQYLTSSSSNSDSEENLPTKSIEVGRPITVLYSSDEDQPKQELIKNTPEQPSNVKDIPVSSSESNNLSADEPKLKGLKWLLVKQLPSEFLERPDHNKKNLLSQSVVPTLSNYNNDKQHLTNANSRLEPEQVGENLPPLPSEVIPGTIIEELSSDNEDLVIPENLTNTQTPKTFKETLEPILRKSQTLPNHPKNVQKLRDRRPKSLDTQKNFSKIFSNHRNRILSGAKSEDQTFDDSRGKSHGDFSKQVEALVSPKRLMRYEYTDEREAEKDRILSGTKSYNQIIDESRGKNNGEFSKQVEALISPKKYIRNEFKGEKQTEKDRSSSSSTSTSESESGDSVIKSPNPAPRMILQQKENHEWDPQNIHFT